MLLYDFRHSECQGNREYEIPGDDSPLTRRGLVQARAAGNYASGKGITAVYSSPLLRARTTAELFNFVYVIDSEQRTVRCELGRAKKPRAYRGDFWIRKANGFLSNLVK